MLSLLKKKSIDFKASSLKVNVDVLFFLHNLFSGLSLRWLNTTTLNNTWVYRLSIPKKEYKFPKLAWNQIFHYYIFILEQVTKK